jgi:hypothetical protein
MSIPTFYKGDLVRPIAPTIAWRRASDEEQRAWYEKFYEDCRAGRDVPYDSGGESRLAPCDTSFTLTPEMTLTVVRGKASAPSGYSTMKNCCQVFCPDNGETLYVPRIRLTGRW